MSEWWTYTPGDFVMFSARSYYRLVERYNAEVWPLHLLAVASGLLALVVALRSDSEGGRRFVALLLAAAWLWVGWGFLQRRFATINWAAEYGAWVFAAEGLALLWVAVATGRRRRPGAARGRAGGAAIAALALLGYPLVAATTGRPWAQAEVFGAMPDPTAAATLGFLLLAPGPQPWLMVIPVASCIGGGAMLLTLGHADGWLPLLFGTSAAGLAWQQRRAGGQTGG